MATFIPIIAALYLFLTLLEEVGYMARAAFVMDKFMRRIGLSGKAFIPLIVGFGCNVPGIMAARTLDTHRERVTTVLMSPFMSCGARLAVYALFAAAFFPVGGQNIVFALYDRCFICYFDRLNFKTRV
ncbi:Ferrous iron transport protein B [uncultured Gammaproteobacteria bacterium]|nr:Ferrous iron transport protein B [uncultured Gammaproteobacteria bacterium]